MRANKFILLALFLALTVFSISQEKQKKWTLSGYLKNMQTIMMSDFNNDWITDNLFHNRLNFKYYPTNSLSMGVEVRNRFFYGEMVNLFDGVNFPLNYSDMINRETGYLNLSGIAAEGNSYFLHMGIDRLWVDYSGEKYQFTAGRQRINWAQTFVWNPNDIFNAYSFFDFDYEEKPGSDALRFQYYLTGTSGFEIAAKVDNKEKVTAAGLYRFNKWKYDFQFLAGILQEEDFVVGTGWSGQLLKGGLRGEASYFLPKDGNDSTGVFLASVGYDYTLKNATFLQFEILYNSGGGESRSFNLNEFYFRELNAKNLSLNKINFFGQASFTISPLLNSGFSAMFSPNDKSIYLGPSLTYSLKSNLDLYFIVQFFSGESISNSREGGAFSSIRLKWSF